MSPPHGPSQSSGFPSILCNITAIIPLMTQFVSRYLCNNPQHLSHLTIYCSNATGAVLWSDYWKIWHFPSVYIFRQIRKSFKQVKWKYYPSHIQATYNDLIVIHRPISMCCINLHWLDGILPWHSESQYVLYRKEKTWINVDLCR